MLVTPCGGTLVDLLEPVESRDALVRRAATLPSFQLSERSRCDLEMLATGGFSPLRTFMSAADHDSVVSGMRLKNGTLFPIPIPLPIPDGFQVSEGQDIALRGPRNDLLAVMHVDEVYTWNREETAKRVFGTLDTKHPLVAGMQSWGSRCISGPLRVASVGAALDFPKLRMTPSQVRSALTSLGRSNVVAFQTRNPLHRAHEEMVRRAIESVDGVLLLHPVAGMTAPGDIDHITRVRTYLALIENYFDADRALLALLPLAMRMAGPREALWHAIIRRNYGANHFIVGRDHASPGAASDGRPFYGPYDAQELMGRHEDEIGVRMIPFREMVYVEDAGRYEEASKVPAGARTRSISGTQLRSEYLERGLPLPEWFTRPEIAAILTQSADRHGFCLWFTGLSASGKSTTAELVAASILERGRQVTLLDGDIVRTHLSKGLGFSKADRDANVLRIGFVASEIVKHGGAVVCAAVSPYRATRDQVREMVGGDRFIEVFMDTPIEVCEARDTKGMYAAARRGDVRSFTGIDDPYEEPLRPDVKLETVGVSALENAAMVLRVLMDRGFVGR